MARIDAAAGAVTLKIVYYGPALGGKTTNLRSLHALVDPAGAIELRSLDTEGDRTLFFDFLPIDLGGSSGIDLRVRTFTVPGQVQYNGTRRLVLQGADAVIFVADSTPDRLGANQESLRNLRANLVANGIPPGIVPIVLQANKRDIPDATSMEDLRTALSPDLLEAYARTLLPGMLQARAHEGHGVVEAFETALRAALAQAFRHHGLGKLGIARDALAMKLDETLVPVRARAAQRVAAAAASSSQSVPAPTGEARRAAHEAAEAALSIDDQLVESVRQSLDLAEALGDQSAVSRQLQRRVAELETIDELSRVLVQTLDAQAIVRAVAHAARAALPGGAASVLVPLADGSLTEGALVGLPVDPLLSTGRPPLAWRVLRQARPVAWSDLETQLACGDAELASRLAPWCTGAAVPLRLPSGKAGLVIAYGLDPDSRAGRETLRFLGAVATQGALALQNADRHGQLQRHREHLEDEVAARTAELRLAHQEIVVGSRLKDRILSCVNHELRTPVTKLLASSQVLERLRPDATPPPAILASVVQQARHLKALLDQVLSAHVLLAPPAPGADAGATDLGRAIEASALACHERAVARKVSIGIEGLEGAPLVAVEAGPLSLMISQLVDNAVKFTKAGTQVRVSVARPSESQVRVLVHDEGPGIPAEDGARIFAEFDQGRGDHLTAKPTGLGLGLSIVRRLARRCGGEVGVANPGTPGATFWLDLPLAPAAATRAAEPPVAVAVGAGA